jgi:putative ATPase
MKDLGYGADYAYAHDHPGNFIDAEFLPESLSGNVFFNPGENKREADIKVFLQKRWKGKYEF